MVTTDPAGKGIVSFCQFNDAHYAFLDRPEEFLWVGSQPWHTGREDLLPFLPWADELSFGEYVEVVSGHTWLLKWRLP